MQKLSDTFTPREEERIRSLALSEIEKYVAEGMAQVEEELAKDAADAEDAEVDEVQSTEADEVVLDPPPEVPTE